MYHVLLAVQYLSIIFLMFEAGYIFMHWKSQLHGWLFLNCVSTLVNNVGYLIVMGAHSADEALLGQKMAYLGKVWVPFTLLVFVLKLCEMPLSNKLISFLGLIHAGTFFIVLTAGKQQLYYTDINFTQEGVFPHLVYGHGVWHVAYTGLLIFYIALGLMCLIVRTCREKSRDARRRLLCIVAVLVSESVLYIIDISGVTRGYDTTVLGFVVGTIFMYVAIFRYDLLDMTELIRSYVVDELSEAIIAVGIDGRIGYFNDPAKALFPELKNRGKMELAELREAIDGGMPLRRDGHIYTPQLRTLYHRGENSGTLCVLVDDTEHYRYMDELREQKRIADEANRAKSAFLANMSHEIRTPINAILGMDEIILRESGEQRITAYAGDIQDAGKTLLSLVNDILDFSKVEEGKMEILPTQYELSSVINDLMNMILGRAEAKGLHFTVNVDESTPSLLFGDEIRIRQCALNILTNAVKYTEKGSVTMDVGYEKLGEDKIALRVRVTDTGIGMKAEDMDKLFSPFDRIEEKRNRSIEGTGLGMSITRQLLDLMGSRLEVESVYGEGSTFSFAVEQGVVKWEGVGRLVCSLEQRTESRKAYRELFHAPQARILVVDDMTMNLTVIRGLLKKTQVQIDTAESGQEALALAGKRRYDAVFIDHMMPGMDGIETLRELRKLPDMEGVPCVALTANAVSGAREAYLDAGFSDYLSKPVDGKKLEKLLASLLPPEKLRAPEAETAAAQSAETARVLVVDDDELICRLAEDILGKSFQVRSCHTGEEALAQAESLRPDLVLLDINLGGTSGFEVLSALKGREATRSIPVVFLTGEKNEEAEIQGFRSGASDFVRKPFAPEVLLQRARRIVALSRLQSDLQSEVRRQTLRAERLTKEMMLALSKSVDAKDHYTNGHSERVAAYSAEIARRMGKSAREQEKLYEMGLMHDIGKIGVGEEIINKPGRLTDEEFAQIRRHTTIGSEILRSITEMPELEQGARSHHERYGGGGYPDGLKGDDIPEAARIICIADSYDAMTSTRTYSTPRPQADVRAELVRCAGSQFDPNIVKFMLDMIDEDTDYTMNEYKADIGVWKESGRLWAHSDAAAEALPAAWEAPAAEADEESAELPAWLYEIGELDAETGLSHCGTEETYLDTLRIYAKSAAACADEISAYWRAGDVENTTVKVHGLKSTSRAVGASALGDLAEKLELAGKAGDTQTLAGGLDELTARCRALGERLSPLLAPEGMEKALSTLSEEKLNGIYDSIRALLADFEFDRAASMIDSLGGVGVPESERERCRQLKELADSFDWDRIGELLA